MLVLGSPARGSNAWRPGFPLQQQGIVAKQQIGRQPNLRAGCSDNRIIMPVETVNQRKPAALLATGSSLGCFSIRYLTPFTINVLPLCMTFRDSSIPLGIPLMPPTDIKNDQ